MANNVHEQKQFSQEIQEYIIDRLACCVKAGQVQAEVKELFDQEASLARLLYYDPTQPQGFKLKAELKARFDATRKAYLADVESVPCAHLAYRLRYLQTMLDDEDNERNPYLRKELLLQAAREQGGMFTNRRIVETPSTIQSGAALDLSRLATEELTVLETLVAKATVPTGDTGGESAPQSR